MAMILLKVKTQWNFKRDLLNYFKVSKSHKIMLILNLKKLDREILMHESLLSLLSIRFLTLKKYHKQRSFALHLLWEVIPLNFLGKSSEIMITLISRFFASSSNSCLNWTLVSQMTTQNGFPTTWNTLIPAL